MAQQTVSRITARILGSSIRQPGYINRSAITARSICTTSRPSTFRQHIQTPLLLFTLPSPRSFQSSSGRHGILPDSSESTPEADEGHKVTQRTEISIEDYHKLSDHLLEELLRKFEQRQEEKGDLDAEYSDGVLHIDMGSKGTYVINKQPPNKQIWLSSPLSGPKRYDWVLLGESMHQKEGGGTGHWVYLRDGSNLEGLLKKEIGIEIGVEDLAAMEASGESEISGEGREGVQRMSGE